jgi:hypothetical protein
VEFEFCVCGFYIKYVVFYSHACACVISSISQPISLGDGKQN